MRTETWKVGIFTTSAVVLAMVVLFFIGNFRFGSKGKPYRVKFTYVADLRPQAPVKYASGVVVGYVETVRAVEGGVEVVLRLEDPRFSLREDSFVTIYTSGFLGEKYVHLDANLGEGRILQEGEILEGVDPYNLDETFRRLDRLSAVLAEILGSPKGKGRLLRTFDNVEKASADLADLSAQTRTRVDRILNFVEKTAAKGEALSSSLQQLAEALDRMGRALNETEWQRAVGDLSKALARMEKLTGKLEKAEGPLGVLLYDRQVAEDLRALVEDLRRHPWKLLWKK